MSGLEEKVKSSRKVGLIGSAALALYMAACGGGNPGPTGPGPNPGPQTATVSGTVMGRYNGSANFGAAGPVTDGNYSVSGVSVGDVDGIFSGDDRYISRVAKFKTNEGANTFPAIDVLEKVVDGVTIDADYLAALVNRTTGVVGGARDGVVSADLSEVLIVEDSFNKTDLLKNLYIFNFKKNAIDNATKYLPELMHDNPKPLKYSIVNGNYSCNDSANRGKVIFKGGTPSDIDSNTSVATNLKWIDSDNKIYCAEIIMTDKSGPASVHHEFANVTGLGDTNYPGVPSIVNKANMTSIISDNDIKYSKIKRKMKNGSKITNGMYDTRNFGPINTVGP